MANDSYTLDKPTDTPPNLLFIMTDHQRADSIGMVQAGIEVTPNLNRLAEAGTNFTRAYNACPLCAPARTALATGKYPTANGIVVNDWRGDNAGDNVPIHQCLAEAGYDVAHIGVDHIRVRPTLRERVQFAKWIGNANYNRYLVDDGMTQATAEDPNAFKREITENQNGVRVNVKYSNTHTALWQYPATHFKDSYFCQQAVDFLNDSPKRPFALFVYLWAPHPPLWVPEPYASMFPLDRLHLPTNINQTALGEPSNRRLGIAAQLAEGISMAQWRRVWAAHLGLVRLADAGIGRVFEALENTGRADDTAVVFLSDHGDHLGQHRMYQKMEMYEPAIRVPFIVRIPGGSPQQLDAPVSHLDIVPTVLDLLGIQQPDGLDGDSLHDAIVSGASPPDKPVFSAYSGNAAVGDIRRAVITDRYKYIYDPADVPELYDLGEDPLEMHNLAADGAYGNVMSDLHEMGKSWAQAHGDWVDFT